MALPITVAVICLLLIALAAYVVTRPPVLRVERSALVGAPAAVVFPIINDLHQWHRWSPYDKRDPDMKRTFDGPPPARAPYTRGTATSTSARAA